MWVLNACWIVVAFLLAAAAAYFLLMIASFYDEALGDAGALPAEATALSIAIPATTLLAAVGLGCLAGRATALLVAGSHVLRRVQAWSLGAGAALAATTAAAAVVVVLHELLGGGPTR